MGRVKINGAGVRVDLDVGGVGWVGRPLSIVVTLSGIYTGLTWQKCSYFCRNCGTSDKLGMRISPATLAITVGSGHMFSLDDKALGQSLRGSSASKCSSTISCGRLISTKSQGQIVVRALGARKTLAHGTFWGPGDSPDEPYLYCVPSLVMTWRFAGLTEMSFSSMNGVPARTSTSRSLTTRPSNKNDFESRVNVSLTSPTTASGELPSAWWADCELVFISALSRVAMDSRIMLPSAPLSIVIHTVWYPWNVSIYGDCRTCTRLIEADWGEIGSSHSLSTKSWSMGLSSKNFSDLASSHHVLSITLGEVCACIEKVVVKSAGGFT